MITKANIKRSLVYLLETMLTLCFLWWVARPWMNAMDNMSLAPKFFSFVFFLVISLILVGLILGITILLLTKIDNDQQKNPT